MDKTNCLIHFWFVCWVLCAPIVHCDLGVILELLPIQSNLCFKPWHCAYRMDDSTTTSNLTSTTTSNLTLQQQPLT